MGLLTEALAPFTRRALQEGPLPLTAARVIEWLEGPATATGVRISTEGALRISAVYDCVRLISEDVASLPLITYRRLPRGKDRATDHPLYRLLHDEPNPYMTAMQVRETLQGHLLLWGNAYANVERDPQGRLVALWPLRPDRMDVPVRSTAGLLLYTYHLPSGEPVSLTQAEVLHLRGLSPDGLMGYSPIALQRETLGNAQALLEYGARFFGNNARPGGVLQVAKTLSKEAAGRLKTSWDEAHRGLTNAHRVAVLEEGVEWKAIGIAPEDAQYLESRKFSRTEIASIYRVPPHKINEMDRATFSNIEEQAIEYVNEALRTWLVRWEQQCNKDLLTERERMSGPSGLFVEHLMDALLRGRYLERQQGLQIQRQNGVINADDWNEIENRNPLPEGQGQLYLQPANLVPLGTAGAESALGATV